MIELKYSRGEIWMVDLNPTKGREQSGIRPALIISDDNFNQGPAELLIVLPITSKNKNQPLHIEILPQQSGLHEISYIKCEDIKSISKERCIKRIGKASNIILKDCEHILKLLLSFG